MYASITKNVFLFSIFTLGNFLTAFAQPKVVPEACYLILETDSVLASDFLPKKICFESLKVNLASNKNFADSTIDVFSSNSAFNTFLRNLKLTHLAPRNKNSYAYKAESEIVNNPGTNCEESVNIKLRLEGSVDLSGHGAITHQVVYMIQATKSDSCHTKEFFTNFFKFELAAAPIFENNFYPAVGLSCDPKVKNCNSNYHRLLCDKAVSDCADAYDNVETCITQTSLNSLSVNSYGISFASCDRGEWITLTLNSDNWDILEGSSGLDSDSCEQ